MKRRITPPLLVFFATIVTNAQPPGCPNFAFTLSTQAQVDNFDDTHPDCHNLTVKMNITGADITNLDGLNGVETTTNSIEIVGNPILASLSGLSNLTSIGVELKIDNNDALPNLTGLDALTFLGGHLSIEGNALLTTLNGMGPIPTLGSYLNISFNPVLTDITALNSLTEVGPTYFNAFLTINNNTSLPAINGLDLITATGSFFFLGSNPAMTTVNGLNGLTTVNGSFEIAGNALLNDLNGFTSLTTVTGIFSFDNNPQLTDILEFNSITSIGGVLTIASNASLSQCEAQGICTFLEGSGTAVIINNATGCNSVPQVEDACLAAPVALTFFRGKHDQEGVLLTWQTASEKNNDHFLVEHRSEGGDFQTLGMVMGNGTSSAVNDYQFEHHQPSEGTNYYRLKQVDFGGKFEYSNIVSVFTEHADEMRIYPNPTAGSLLILGNAHDGTARVSDVAGRLVQEQSIFGNDLIDLAGQPKGVYFIEIQTNGGKTIKRIIKE